MTRFGGGFATGIGGQLGLLDLYHQLLVLSFPLPGKHSHAGGHRFGTFLTDWLSAVCGVVVLLHLASHLVVIGGGGRRRAWENKRKEEDFLSCFRVISRRGTMKYMKLGSKPDAFQTEGSNIRLIDFFLSWLHSSFRL